MHPELALVHARSLTGYLSEGALSGVWAIGGVNDESMREERVSGENINTCTYLFGIPGVFVTADCFL